MKAPLLLCATVLLACLTACNSPQRYTRNRQAGEQWLSGKTGTARINLTGAWHSDDWGNAIFVQGQNRVNGQISSYTAYGRVSGSKAYILISQHGWIYYTAELSMPNKNELTGSYSKSVGFQSLRQKVIHFRRQ
ncbi:MAG: hypothetical protein ABI443_01430 [Chthoniobacterales bacterium]